MLITNVPYRQKYLATCMRTVQFVLEYSGLTKQFYAVPAEAGGHMIGEGSLFYYPDIKLYWNLPREDWGYITFRYSENVTNAEDMLYFLTPGLRDMASIIKRLINDPNLPSSDELFAKFEKIYTETWKC